MPRLAGHCWPALMTLALAPVVRRPGLCQADLPWRLPCQPSLLQSWARRSYQAVHQILLAQIRVRHQRRRWLPRNWVQHCRSGRCHRRHPWHLRHCLRQPDHRLLHRGLQEIPLVEIHRESRRRCPPGGSVGLETKDFPRYLGWRWASHWRHCLIGCCLRMSCWMRRSCSMTKHCSMTKKSCYWAGVDCYWVCWAAEASLDCWHWGIPQVAGRRRPVQPATVVDLSV